MDEVLSKIMAQVEILTNMQKTSDENMDRRVTAIEEQVRLMSQRTVSAVFGVLTAMTGIAGLLIAVWQMRG